MKQASGREESENGFRTGISITNRHFFSSLSHTPGGEDLKGAIQNLTTKGCEKSRRIPTKGLKDTLRPHTTPRQLSLSIPSEKTIKSTIITVFDTVRQALSHLHWLFIPQILAPPPLLHSSPGTLHTTWNITGTPLKDFVSHMIWVLGLLTPSPATCLFFSAPLLFLTNPHSSLLYLYPPPPPFKASALLASGWDLAYTPSKMKPCTPFNDSSHWRQGSYHIICFPPFLRDKKKKKKKVKKKKKDLQGISGDNSTSKRSNSKKRS